MPRFKLVSVLLIVFLVSSKLVFAADEALTWRYSVRPGDNLIHFGRAYLINPDDWKLLQKLNQVKNPSRMPVGSILKVPLTLLKQGPAEAEIVQVSGNAVLQTGNTSRPITLGQKLGPGASLVTKENSKVVIKFADGTLTTMASNSMLTLDTLSIYSGGGMVDTKLRLQQGQAETQANPKHVIGNTMQIITPTAIAAVRGTQFRVATDATSVKQETLEGQVALAATGQEVAVNKGYGSFAEGGAPPSPPIALLQAVDTAQLNAVFDRLPISFNAPKQTGAVAWVGKIAKDSDFNQVLGETESKGTALNFSDIPDGQYYLNIRAKDKNGLSGYDATHAFSVNARPFEPNLITPLAGKVLRESRPILDWQPAADVTLYAVDVATDAEFKHTIAAAKVESNRYQLVEALQPGQYFWRVASISVAENGMEDRGPSFNVAQFSYKALPPKPDISALRVNVLQNRVYVQTSPPVDGYHYRALLNNPFNHQSKIWVGDDLQQEFNFLLKEYGEQLLSIQYVDTEGVAGPEAIYTFDAQPR